MCIYIVYREREREMERQRDRDRERDRERELVRKISVAHWASRPVPTWAPSPLALDYAQFSN